MVDFGPDGFPRGHMHSRENDFRQNSRFVGDSSRSDDVARWVDNTSLCSHDSAISAGKSCQAIICYHFLTKLRVWPWLVPHLVQILCQAFPGRRKLCEPGLGPSLLRLRRHSSTQTTLDFGTKVTTASRLVALPRVNKLRQIHAYRRFVANSIVMCHGGW